MYSSAPRIIIIDPHPITREGVVTVLSTSLAGSKVTGRTNFQETLTFMDHNPVDLVITDFRVQGDTALSLLKTLKSRNPGHRCLILSASDEIQVGYPCIRAGASGFVGKSAPVAQIVNAVCSILDGHPYVSERLARKLMEAHESDSHPSAGSILTNRELQVFSLIGEGIAVSTIATKLNLSVKTVEAHREHIKTKLGHQNASQLAAAAVRWLDGTSVAI